MRNNCCWPCYPIYNPNPNPNQNQGQSQSQSNTTSDKYYLIVHQSVCEITIITDKENSSGILISGRKISILSNYATKILIEHFTTTKDIAIGEHVYPEYLQDLLLWLNCIVKNEVIGICNTLPKKTTTKIDYKANTPLPTKYYGKSIRFSVDGSLELVLVNEKKVYILTLNDDFKKYADFKVLNKFKSVINYGEFGTTLCPSNKSSFAGTNCVVCGDCSLCSSCSSCLLSNDMNFTAGLLSFSSTMRTISISSAGDAFISTSSPIQEKEVNCE